ncbi:Fe-S cluster assembly protein SufD [uncultured Brevundimonas sp.]|uniref:Fe-S cluster assembly protein SufD n=1 Tax=uncultured Brevundimonas sp. TaxID=213418 RepID=UPI0030EE661C
MNAPVRIDLNDVSTFPSKRVETWKYTDLQRGLRDAPPPSPPGVVDGSGPFFALGGDGIVFANGRAVGADAYVGRGRKTLRLRFVSDAVGTGHTTTVRIAAQPDADLLILESHEGRGSAYAAHNRLTIDVAPRSTVTRIVLVDEPGDAVSITQATVNVGQGGRYRQTILTTGARLQRLETQVTHDGHAADVRLDGLYVLSDSRQSDQTTVVDHVGPDGLTAQLTKGVVRDSARGVFQGKIIVERGADGTDARMGHHALILGERAEVDAKPELQIYADDVQCAHGNTVGNLDEAALFYLQQRGLPLDEARALLTEAFLREVTDRIEPEAVRDVVNQWLTGRL